MRAVVKKYSTHRQNFFGRIMSPDEAEKLVVAVPACDISRIVLLMMLFPLAGTVFYRAPTPEDDEEHEFKWMDADEIIDEATEAYPGLVSVRYGFLPVGADTFGTGNQYFVNVDDEELPMYKIFHDAVDPEAETLLVDSMKLVFRTIADIVDFAGAGD